MFKDKQRKNKEKQITFTGGLWKTDFSDSFPGT